MASLVAILDLKGKPLIQRSYRDDVAASHIERFLPLILEMEEEGQPVTPCFTNQGVNFTYIRHSNLYRQFKLPCVSVVYLFQSLVLALSKRNPHAAEIILWLHHLVAV